MTTRTTSRRTARPRPGRVGLLAGLLAAAAGEITASATRRGRSPSSGLARGLVDAAPAVLVDGGVALVGRADKPGLAVLAAGATGLAAATGGVLAGRRPVLGGAVAALPHVLGGCLALRPGACGQVVADVENPFLPTGEVFSLLCCRPRCQGDIVLVEPLAIDRHETQFAPRCQMVGIML